MENKELKEKIARIKSLEIRVTGPWNDNGYGPSAFTLLCRDGDGSSVIIKKVGIGEIEKFVRDHLLCKDLPLKYNTPEGTKPHQGSNISRQLRPVREYLHSPNYIEQN